MKRRHFLQASGGFLTALGLSNGIIQRQGMQYGKVLAQNTSRKLALLVGINGYPGADKLDGCVNDVQLQRELLIHRFGFNPKDILLVTDETPEKPTRENILRAFEEHLINQAQAGDVAVFHYSGHGSKVRAADANSTFVPLDSQWKSGLRADQMTVDDIMGHTLYLLMSAIKTEYVTAVLDSCYSGGGTRGNTKIRSIERDIQTNNILPSPKELDYQDYWLNKLNFSREAFKQGYEEKVARGMVLASAGESELAADGTSVGYPAGAFTYALTQYLWQATGDDPLHKVMRGVGLGTTRISSTGQNPLYEVHTEEDKEEPILYLDAKTPSGEGVITEVRQTLVPPSEVVLWLGGFNPQSLNGASKDAIFRVVDPKGKEKGEVILRERDGLVAIAVPNPENPVTDPAVGDFIQEKAIAIPEDFALYIALDGSLQDVAAEFEDFDDRIELVSLGAEQPVDYILGTFTDEIAIRLSQSTAAKDYSELKATPQVGSLGIFNAAAEIVPESFGEVGEELDVFKKRLIPKLRSFLGKKLINTLFGVQEIGGGDRLKVSATLDIFLQEGEAAISSRDGITRGAEFVDMEGAVPLLPVETDTQITITNEESESLYIGFLVFDQVGHLVTIFPDVVTNSAESSALVAAGDSFMLNSRLQRVERTGDSIPISEPLGTTELLILASKEPIHRPLKALQQLMSATRSRSAFDEIGDFVTKTRGYANSANFSIPTAVIGSTSITFKAIK